MKNKIICIAAALVLALTAYSCSSSGSGCSCGSGENTPDFDATLPWEQIDNGTETCTYSVTKSYVQSKSGDVPIATGSYVTKISTDPSNSKNSVVSNAFDITYNQSSHTKTLAETGQYVINAGLTDSYTGSAVFNKDTLVPTSADKTFSLAQRPLCDSDVNGVPAGLPERIEEPEEGVLYRYVLNKSVKYGDPRGYSYEANYETNKTKFSTTKGSTKEVKNGDSKVYYRDYKNVTKSNIKLKNDASFDNEQINYVVRALKSIKKKGSDTIYLTNIFDSYNTGSYVRYTMSVSCAENTKKVTLALDPSKYVIKDSEKEFEPNEDGKVTVPCLEVSVGISGAKSGPAIKFLITAPSVTVAMKGTPNMKMKKLIVRMTYSEYSPKDVKLAYKTVYELSDYSAGY